MPPLALLILLSGLAVGPAWAQTVGTCQTGTADAYLDVGNVRARLFNTGGLFYRSGPNSYEVPKGRGKHTVFASGIWMGGLVDGELRTAGSTYGPWEFWPGPLPAPGDSLKDCSRFDRMWTLSRADVEVYLRRGETTEDLRDWPTGLGAPTLDPAGSRVDVSGLTPEEQAGRTINLAAGEIPLMVGDQMVWWVMNDLGGPHTRFLSSYLPQNRVPGLGMGVEIRALAIAFDQPGVLQNTTLYRYEFSKPYGSPLEQAYLGVFQDADVGYFGDDYVGSDTTLGLGYAYNADNDDYVEIGGYGAAPPAVGLDFFRGPLVDDDGRDNDHDGLSDEPGERASMTSFLYYFGGAGPQGEASLSSEMYFQLQGRWRDGTPQTWGGNGYDFSDIPVTMGYTGNPPEAWSEFDLGDGTAAGPSDRRFVAGTGPFRLAPNRPQDIVFGIITSFGADNLDSVRKLKDDDRFVQRLIDDDILFQPMVAPRPAPEIVYDFAASVYPVPATSDLKIAYSLPREMLVSIRVFDVLGRLQRTVVSRQVQPGSYRQAVDVSSWTPGAYVVRVQIGQISEARRILVVR